MDKEQARFILRSFRPDGADAGDPEFAEALKLAMESRELGEWLASERAFDAEFAQALGSLDLPQNLREDIMACLAAERGDFAQAVDETDASWISAMASIQPPAGLRDAVIAAMDRTGTQQSVAQVVPLFRRLAIPLAAAAGIALAFLFTRSERPSRAVAETGSVPIDVVQAGFVRTFESPSFTLEEKREDPRVLIRHLQERKLPCPGALPRGLEHLKGLGCRELVVDGKHGSLICFSLDGSGLVHLVIFRRKDVSGEIPPKDSPAFVQSGEWASARWGHGDKVFLLMSRAEVGKLTGLF